MVTKDKSEQTLKSHTFDPRRGGWYYCHQTGQHLRRAQILGAVMSALNDSTDIYLITPGAPKLGKTKVQNPKKG